MSRKSKIIETVNKRMDMISESLPPPVTFTEVEVMQILWEIEGADMTPKASMTEEEIAEIYRDKEILTSKFKLTEAYQNALRRKGIHIGDGGCPDGAFE